MAEPAAFAAWPSRHRLTGSDGHRPVADVTFHHRSARARNLEASHQREDPTMRMVHWLFVVSVALFVTGIAFTIAGARSARAAPAAETTVTATPVATVEQIMKGIVGPAANVVFAAVGSVSTAQGIEERAPRTADEWEVVGNNAAALVESGNLLLMPGRAVDQGEWIGLSRAMMQAAQTALKAVDARNPEGILESGDAINTTCDSCHERYRRN
jgi:hypothetical protein